MVIIQDLAKWVARGSDPGIWTGYKDRATPVDSMNVSHIICPKSSHQLRSLPPLGYYNQHRYNRYPEPGCRTKLLKLNWLPSNLSTLRVRLPLSDPAGSFGNGMISDLTGGIPTSKDLAPSIIFLILVCSSPLLPLLHLGILLPFLIRD